MLKPCRDCGRNVSEEAVACPQCGSPRPALTMAEWQADSQAQPQATGQVNWQDVVAAIPGARRDRGWEYKSSLTVFGMPLIHISFKYRANRTPVIARGFVAIGQFACGVFTVSQFGVGVISVSQFTIAGFALAQFAVAYSLIAQMGLYVHEGHGQIVRRLADVVARLF